MIDLEKIEERLKHLRWTSNDDLYASKRWISEREGGVLKELIQIVGAKSYVESGTANGFSVMWAALGLPEDGKAYTYDPVDRPKMYQDPSIGCTELDSKIEFIEDRFIDIEERLKDIQHPIVCFIDGDHDGGVAARDWRTLGSILQPGDLVVFHDLNLHGVSMDWHDITKGDPESSFFTFITQRVLGVVLYKAESKELRLFERNFCPETALSCRRDGMKRAEEVGKSAGLRDAEAHQTREARRHKEIAARKARRHKEVAARNAKRKASEDKESST